MSIDDRSLRELAEAREFDELRSRFPDEPDDVVFDVAEYLREEDLYQLAIELYDHLLPRRDTAEVHFGIGQCHGKIYDYETAIGHLQRAFELDPDRAEGANYHAYILERLERTDEADAWYRKALAGLYGEDLWTLSHYAYFLEKAGRRDEARKAYDAVLDLDPGYTWAVKRYAVFLLAEGEGDRAEELMRGALEAFPERPFVKLNYLEFQILRGDRDAYQRYFREIADEAPAPWFPVVVSLMDYFFRYLLQGESDPEQVRDYERRATALVDSVHRDFDDLNALLAEKGGDEKEWKRLVGCLLK